MAGYDKSVLIRGWLEKPSTRSVGYDNYVISTINGILHHRAFQNKNRQIKIIIICDLVAIDEDQRRVQIELVFQRLSVAVSLLLPTARTVTPSLLPSDNVER